MKLSELRNQINTLIELEGDMEATCTGTLFKDTDPHGPKRNDPITGVAGDVFESTVESIRVHDHTDPSMGKVAKLQWQKH